MAWQVIVNVSRDALRAMTKDKVLRENKKWFFRQIEQLKIAAENEGRPNDRPSETIGGFFVCPRGDALRIAYTFERDEANKKVTVFICEFMAHDGNEYRTPRSNNWIAAAKAQRITRSTYEPYDAWDRA